MIIIIIISGTRERGTAPRRLFPSPSSRIYPWDNSSFKKRAAFRAVVSKANFSFENLADIFPSSSVEFIP